MQTRVSLIGRGIAAARRRYDILMTNKTMSAKMVLIQEKKKKYCKVRKPHRYHSNIFYVFMCEINTDYIE